MPEPVATFRIQVRVTPRSSRSTLLGAGQGVWKAALHAPPADGRANEELLGLIAAALSVPRSSLQLVHGAKSRIKTVEGKGLTQDRAESMLESACRGDHPPDDSRLKKDASSPATGRK